MPAFNEQLQKIAEARSVLSSAEQNLYLELLDLQKARKPETLAEIAEAIQGKKTALQQAKNNLATSIGQLHQIAPYKQLTSHLEARYPVLLLPMRIETRFAGNQLWVRAYPDDIHIHSHEPLLTDAELKTGHAYWTALAEAYTAEDTPSTAESSKKEAWKVLVDNTSPQRALWVAQKTQPSNWTPAAPVQAAELVFPVQEMTKTHSWTQAPRTQLLPDKLVVSIYKHGQVVFEKEGAAIPDTVFVGPDPFKAEEAFKVNGFNIEFEEDFAWTTDFEKAVALGLGFKIDLQEDYFHQNKIERISVMGVLSSAAPTESQKMLERLLENHRYSRKGIGLLKQGAATNNTESANSSFSRSDTAIEKGYFDGSPADALEANTEGHRLVNALGISPSYLEGVPFAGIKEHEEAKAMNTALYPATLGHFFEVLMKPLIKEAALVKLRAFFQQFVSARGPLPALRIGQQPYGVLVTSDLAQWQERDGFFGGLASVLKGLQNKWNSIADTKAVHLGMNNDPDQLFLEILSLQAGSVDFQQQMGNLPDFCYTLPNIVFDDFQPAAAAKQQQIVNYLKTLGFDPEAPDNYYPYASSLIFYNNFSPIDIKKLVDGKLATDNRFLDKLEGQDINYIDWLAQVASLEMLEKNDFGGQAPPRFILYLLLRHALLSELQRKTEVFYAAKDYPAYRSAFFKSFTNFDTQSSDLTSWELLKGVPTVLDAQKFTVNQSLGDYFLQLPAEATDADGIAEMRLALQGLAQLPTGKLQQYLSDHLDLCTYRLDAWQTGLFSRRLSQKRQEAEQGIYIGAFGWVENLSAPARKVVDAASMPEQLRPQDQSVVFKQNNNAGFVHTPSLNHATAAGLLLAGYHNHAQPSDPGVFAVNLSSERVRRAMSVFEGVRNGQSLEALLGYQFERALHDITTGSSAINLNQYILAFREKFTIESHSIPQQGAPQAQETITPYAVTNGLTLSAADDSVVDTLVPNSAHATLVKAEKHRLADTLDALNDLLIAESAYQAAQGNYDRTAALLNSVKSAELPSELEVVKTPRSSQLGLTNRIMLHFRTDVIFKAGGKWSANPAPRALMEPGLNHWLASVLGDPSLVVCRVAALDEDDNEVQAKNLSLANLDLHPIDFVYLAGKEIQTGAGELESRIAHEYRSQVTISAQMPVKITFHPPVPNINTRTFAQMLPLARALRTLITTARPACAKDYASRSPTQTEKTAAYWGWQEGELRTRLQDVLSKLKSANIQISHFTLTAPQVPDATMPANFGVLFDNYFNNGQDKSFLEGFSLSMDAGRQLIVFQRTAAQYGVALAYPDNLNFLTNQTQFDLLAKSASVWKSMQNKQALAEQKLAEASAATRPEQRIELLIAAGKAIMGDEFVIIPQFNYSNPAELTQTYQNEDQLLAHIRQVETTTNKTAMETWVQSLARVRPAIGKLEEVRMLAEALNDTEINFKAAQVPYRAHDSWLAVEFPATDELGKPFQVIGDTLALAVYGNPAALVNREQAALVVDEWTETIPGAEEMTGIAFNYDQPNATPPQTLLLAVEPTGAEHWNWDTLQHILADTLQRAKSRAVEPRHLLEDEALDTLLPMTVASFDLQNTNVSLDYLTVSDQLMAAVQGKGLQLYQAWTNQP